MAAPPPGDREARIVHAIHAMHCRMSRGVPSRRGGGARMSGIARAPIEPAAAATTAAEIAESRYRYNTMWAEVTAAGCAFPMTMMAMAGGYDKGCVFNNIEDDIEMCDVLKDLAESTQPSCFCAMCNLEIAWGSVGQDDTICTTCACDLRRTHTLLQLDRCSLTSAERIDTKSLAYFDAGGIMPPDAPLYWFERENVIAYAERANVVVKSMWRVARKSESRWVAISSKSPCYFVDVQSYNAALQDGAECFVTTQMVASKDASKLVIVIRIVSASCVAFRRACKRCNGGAWIAPRAFHPVYGVLVSPRDP